ncbi:MAG: thiamine-phosphate kinase [Nitrospirae bacterium CG_4_10_14_0_8_um_filter_41_23]|nr:thiamine-phosphate kinase [Nitrospirota bacterium]OIP59223.1 MAG: thiamine-phosphate kinase [Nitrospirae bacterium CG2_30_41_42]PIQ95275.1 MAG: thiamine-phosphate kinase [Nitrospirae bacterium CG11_big_fil_rev_8_21_14_0_20_41_14]PIV44133.1 MAG: thiamine-phosphate kinase [Nitrospirae bacterium CG02_land_8_20_14_3_00_41_53]PIW87260.1 MAG: thiamine-phosphate kinase [Nitrospirae bacterium CG_4_8_14_3_um_filter_41_47]PIY86847.1 MAG: thiamine-phosphate kinase [Nitrospirae bacterium CG_4_10_14_0_8
MKLSQIGELSLLEQIRRSFYKKSKNVVVGIGDDAAVVKPLGKNLLVTTDMMVEGVHFNLHFTTPYQLGFKLISVNVSDIYAMGGKPFYLLLNIAVNKNTNTKFINRFFDGVKDALTLYDTILIGGDLSATNIGISLSATLIGYVKKHIKRSGANIGDKIYVTGYLGDSACGLELLKKIKRHVPLLSAKGKELRAKSKDPMLYAQCSKLFGEKLSWKVVEPLLRRHLMPEARDPKRFLKDATSMIDISDGLLIDLTRLCNESKVGARIYIENIPVSPELKQAASHLGISPVKLALSGGEDYELLFTALPNKKTKAFCIGEITKSERVIIDNSGRERPLVPEGYQHFAF